MCLSDAPCNISLRILNINSEYSTKKKLLSMGIHPEDSLIKVTDMNWGGIIIQNLSTNSTKLALSRSLANIIEVAYAS